MGSGQTIRGFYPDARTRKIAKIILVSSIVFLTVGGSIGPWLPGLVATFGSMSPSIPLQTQGTCPIVSNSTSSLCPQPNGSARSKINPNSVGADQVPNLSLPKTIVSSLSSLVSDGGVVMGSSQNMTLYNLAVSLRLLGGPFPHDELIGPGGRALSSYSFWEVEANLTGQWVPLLPVSNNFTLLGTNASGTDVVRTMQVVSGPFSGVFQ